MKSLLTTALGRGLLLTGLSLSLTFVAQAQGPGGGGVQPGGGAAVTPIDGGASLLLASGLAYGLKRLRRNRK